MQEPTKLHNSYTPPPRAHARSPPALHSDGALAVLSKDSTRASPRSPSLEVGLLPWPRYLSSPRRKRAARSAGQTQCEIHGRWDRLEADSGPGVREPVRTGHRPHAQPLQGIDRSLPRITAGGEGSLRSSEQLLRSGGFSRCSSESRASPLFEPRADRETPPRSSGRRYRSHAALCSDGTPDSAFDTAAPVGDRRASDTPPRGADPAPRQRLP